MFATNSLPFVSVDDLELAAAARYFRIRWEYCFVCPPYVLTDTAYGALLFSTLTD